MNIKHKALIALERISIAMPWWLISLASKALAAIVYAVVRLRREVVEENIRRSFPNMSRQERQEIVWGFYQSLTYQILSAPKILNLPPETIIQNHVHLIGTEQIEALAKQGMRTCIVLMGHVGNWEILSAANITLRKYGLQLEQLYRPLRNAEVDKLQLEQRNRHGAISTPKTEAGRSVIRQMKSTDRPTVMAFIADQTPQAYHTRLWTTFLNQPTPWLDGAERLARKYHLPVFYLDIERVTEREYRASFVEITTDGSLTAQGEITRIYASMLESTIQRDPAIWLWSHRRWKHQPPQSEGEETARV